MIWFFAFLGSFLGSIFLGLLSVYLIYVGWYSRDVVSEEYRSVIDRVMDRHSGDFVGGHVLWFLWSFFMVAVGEDWTFYKMYAIAFVSFAVIAAGCRRWIK